MANWSNPTLTSTYTDFLGELKNRDDDLAKQFDGTTSSNLATGTIRWNSTANRWQKWNGSAWAELTGTYALTALTTTSNASIGGTLAVTGATTLAAATATTPATGNNSTAVATTAYVRAQAYAPLASPALTGTPTVPTAAVNTNTTQAASTAFVQAEIANDAPSKTGVGASGTWGISVTGNAATVTTNANLTGDVTSVGNATAIAAGVIVNADINASAGIVDTKLATITTPGKIADSALPDTISSNITGNSATTSGCTFSSDSSPKDNITTRTDSGFYESSTGTLAEGWPTNSGGFHHLISCTHTNNDNYYALQLASRFDTQDLYFRNTSGSGTTAWSKTLVSGGALGTPSSGTLTNCTFPTLNQNTTGNAATVTTNANLTGHITSVGNAAVLGSFTSAQLAAALTNETGTGAAVFATSPTLVTPILGTPTSGNLANCTFPTLNQSTTGNAATATNLSSNRTFALTGDVTGSVSSNLSSGASIAATVVDNSHSHSVSTITDIASSFFTPTADTFTNLSAVTIGTSEFMYVLVDDKVMVWGSIDVDATATGDWAFRLSIPITRSTGFGNSTSASGTAISRNATDYSAIIQSLTASTTQVTVLGYAGTTAARTVKFHFVYDF